MLKQVQHDNKCLNMLTIPISFFLIIYFIVLAVLAVFFAVNFFHIVLTGTNTFSSFVATLFAVIAVALTLFGTWYFLQGVDLSQQITIWNKSWLGGLNGPSF